MLGAALAEVFSLGAVVPFIMVLTAPEKLMQTPYVSNFFNYAHLQKPEELVYPLIIIFVVMALLSGSIRLLLVWCNTRLSASIGADFSYEIYRKTLYQPYSVHIARNSNELISGIIKKTDGVAQIILSLLTLFSSSLIFMAIVGTLLISNPKIAVIAAGGFSFIYGLVIYFTRSVLYRNGHRIAKEQNQVVKALQEGLGGIRDILLDGTQEFYCKTYADADFPLRRATGYNSFIGQSPRYVVETVGIILIAVLAFMLSKQPGGIVNSLAVVGILALGAQRLLPVLQQLYQSWTVVVGYSASFQDIVAFLQQPLLNKKYLNSKNSIFNKSVELKSVYFKYAKEGPEILSEINLQIAKGSRIGIVGCTGSGKSTLLDIIMGLLSPTSGSVCVDGVLIQEHNIVSWQKNIAHVPQSIYLADATIAENIAFGVPIEQIDYERVHLVAKQAQIAAFIESSPLGYHAFVGERGVRLSGGQRQRIGIARALYKQANFLIFDEATSALDNLTELEVMNALENLGTELTILMVAHRLTTVKRCDIIVELESGKIIFKGSYNQLAENSVTFNRMIHAVA